MMRLLLAILALGAAAQSLAQAVKVTLLFDTNRISVGQTTTLRAMAEIVPEFKPESLQIFSWYVNLENTAPTYGTANYAAIDRPASDMDPAFSSPGVTVGVHRHGIYDTFMNWPGAGRHEPIELFSVPVTGISLGSAVFRLAPGTGVDGLASDFIVAPEGGGEPFLGGDYADAVARLEVLRASVTPVPLRIVQAPIGPGRARVTISYTVQPNANHFLEYKNTLAGSWATLAGSPHNSGTVIETNTLPTRFYRLRIAPQ